MDKSIKQHFLKCHASTLNVKDKKSTFTQGTKGIAETQLWIIERKSGKRKTVRKDVYTLGWGISWTRAMYKIDGENKWTEVVPWKPQTR